MSCLTFIIFRRGTWEAANLLLWIFSILSGKSTASSGQRLSESKSLSLSSSTMVFWTAIALPRTFKERHRCISHTLWLNLLLSCVGGKANSSIPLFHEGSLPTLVWLVNNVAVLSHHHWLLTYPHDVTLLLFDLILECLSSPQIVPGWFWAIPPSTCSSSRWSPSRKW